MARPEMRVPWRSTRELMEGTLRYRNMQRFPALVNYYATRLPELELELERMERRLTDTMFPAVGQRRVMFEELYGLLRAVYAELAVGRVLGGPRPRI